MRQAAVERADAIFELPRCFVTISE